MKRQLNVVLVTFSFLIVSMVALSGCSTQNPMASAQAAVPNVKVISLQSLTSQGISGKVAVNEKVEIYSKLSGRIANMNVEEGNKVKKGDVLVQLESNELEQQVDQAQAGLDGAKAKLADTLAGAREEEVSAAKGVLDQAKALVDQTKAVFDLAEKQFNQAKNHYDSGDITKDDLDNVTLNYQKAKASYDQAAASVVSAQSKLNELKAGPTSNTVNALNAAVQSSQSALNLAKINLQNATLVSPIAGIVVKKFAHTGEMAFTMMPTGTALLEIASINPVKVEVSVPETMVSQLKEGTTLDIQVPSLQDKKFQGTIAFISPVSDDNNNTFPIKLIVQNPDFLLRGGTVVNVNFNNGEQNRIELPKNSLLTKDGKTVIFKVEGDTVHQIAVQTEEKNKDWVYLKDGSQLKNSDKIVIAPDNQLADGTKVHVE